MKKRGLSRSGWWMAVAALGTSWVGAAALGLTLGSIMLMFQSGSDVLQRYFRADFSQSSQYGKLLFETVLMGVWGTVLALLIAFPLMPFAARNAAPNRFSYHGTRELLNLMRSIPDALFALLFVQAVGLGPFAGILALGVHSAGFYGKTIADCMERVPAATISGVQSCGATSFQAVRFAIWPSVVPEMTSYALYLLDRNIRIATTLGMVGAGGIGVEFTASLRTFQYGKAGALVALTLLMIVLIDIASNFLRSRISKWQQ